MTNELKQVRDVLIRYSNRNDISHEAGILDAIVTLDRLIAEQEAHKPTHSLVRLVNALADTGISDGFFDGSYENLVVIYESAIDYQKLRGGFRQACIDEAMIAAAPTPPITEAQGWQPIETAPKDGRAFLINCPDVESEMTIATYEKGILVSIFDGKPYLSHVTKPTHWMPLPAAPTYKGGE